MMYQTKPKNTIVGFSSYYKVFRIYSDVKRPYNMNTFVKNKQQQKKQKVSFFFKQLNSNIANGSFSFGLNPVIYH